MEPAEKVRVRLSLTPGVEVAERRVERYVDVRVRLPVDDIEN